MAAPVAWRRLASDPLSAGPAPPGRLPERPRAALAAGHSGTPPLAHVRRQRGGATIEQQEVRPWGAGESSVRADFSEPSRLAMLEACDLARGAARI